MSSKPVLGYWEIRGLAQPIRLMLHYLGVDFEDKLYGFGSGEKPTGESWHAEKFNHGLDFPNIPYWIDGDVKLTESSGILRYVARTRAPQLMPVTAQEEAVALMVEGVVKDLHTALVNLAHAGSSRRMLIWMAPGLPNEPLETALAPRFQQLETFFEKRKFVLGDQISYVDFYVYEALVQFSKYNKEFLKPYPALQRHVQHIEALPQLTEYIKASEKLPCYSPFATLQI